MKRKKRQWVISERKRRRGHWFTAWRGMVCYRFPYVLGRNAAPLLEKLFAMDFDQIYLPREVTIIQGVALVGETNVAGYE